VVVSKLHRFGGRGVAAVGDGLVRQGLPFIGLALVHQLLIRSDGFMLAGLGVSSGEIGGYGAATAPVWGLAAVAQLAAVAVYPTLSRVAVEGRLRTVHALVIGSLGWILGAALGSALSAVREPLMVLVYGEAFRDSAETLAVVAWVLPWACGSMVLGVVVAALRRQAWSLYCQTLLLCAAVASYVLVIPRWAVTGCAWTLVALQTAAFVAILALSVAATRKPGRAAPIVEPLPAEP
jgi:O-antigen/teichoic acid export membrane protein